ncbi:hypothetical protein [Rugamonas sp. DEMB1]|uniref:hypothetical protein n=1 Tax=Rugamonas sp. DEMB1 TaxID=3039386 RepID=UPI002446C0AD|nr:hypothetical protein [Rugamonas sp. DEMB1]WGG48124.1 hypothetical protein QC826_15370 [Rugamonas sp. DEMB1]
MLSRGTLELLQKMQDLSHAEYPEGGLLYTYTEAANQAHSKMSKTGHSSFPDAQLREFAQFLQVAHGHYGVMLEQVSDVFVKTSRELIQALCSDLKFDEIDVVFEDCGTDMATTLSMARRSDNRHFSLWLWWSID